MILRILLLLCTIFYGIPRGTAADVSKQDVCYYRCLAECVGFFAQNAQNSTSIPISDCESQCASYRQPNLCNDETCWSTCNNRMSAQRELNSSAIIISDTSRGLEWNTVPDATLYVVAYKSSNQIDFDPQNVVISTKPFINRPTSSNFDPCSSLDVKITAFSKSGPSKTSAPHKIGPPTPSADPKLKLLKMRYVNKKFLSDFYEANGTVDVTFEYITKDWPLGSDDLQVTPLFHLISCIEPDLSQGIPVPEFVNGARNSTIVASIGADMMYRKCRFVYYLQSVASKKCGTITEMHSPPSAALQTVQIQCDIVQDAPCHEQPVYDHPICGQVDNIKYEIIDPPSVDYSDETLNVTVNVTFTPLRRANESPTLYYMGIFGEATSYPSKEEETFLGVNITRFLGTTSSCRRLLPSGECQGGENFNHTMVLSGLHPRTMYGLTICAVKDARNLTFPDVTTSTRSQKPKADKILLDKPGARNLVGILVGSIVGGTVVAVLLVIIIIYYLRNKHRKQEKLYKLKIAQIERDSQNRYIDFPAAIKHDIWEIERRNLIIHDDKKLGSGAFGTVYLGRLIGKSLAHKDANSPLGVNLMRAENCEVAVKMLPEYADDSSKGEFLREIGLMKTLGYHERLVNMMACITDSEPLCLVVEYCSDGDLLQYLRHRCKYMMRLDELHVNYHEPPVDNNYDPAFIITIKQLLQFAVQISYGLEYLSQKGFVHRDVAARNVLINDGNSCKIGDFGLCRYIYSDQSQYRSKGGRLPLKWMSPEAIRNYEFSIKSDVWSFGILLFEIITLGGSPYPGMPPEQVLPFLEAGGRIQQPDNCPDEFYNVMTECWCGEPESRPEFSEIRMKLATQLEDLTEDYSYLKLDADKDYYNVQYGDQKKEEVIIIPDGASKIEDRRQSEIDIKHEPEPIKNI